MISNKKHGNMVLSLGPVRSSGVNWSVWDWFRAGCWLVAGVSSENILYVVRLTTYEEESEYVCFAMYPEFLEATLLSRYSLDEFGEDLRQVRIGACQALPSAHTCTNLLAPRRDLNWRFFATNLRQITGWFALLPPG